MGTSQIQIVNGGTVTIEAGSVVFVDNPAQTLATLMAGAPLDSAITWPGGKRGQLRLTCAAGTVAHMLTLYAQRQGNLLAHKHAIAIAAGASVTAWPARLDCLDRLNRVTTAINPGGTLTVELLAWLAKLAGDRAAKCIGIYPADRPRDVAPGALMLLVSRGSALCYASGAVALNDELVAAPNGDVRKRAMGDVACDSIGKALGAAAAGELVNVDVNLVAIP
jgi:hypothetical protein